MNSNSDPTPAPNESPRLTPPESANPDPLTQELGAHPVGVGLGAAGAGAVGAALGAIAGPIGMIAGAAVGALAGGLLGKEAAETVNPTQETNIPPADAETAPLSASSAVAMPPPLTSDPATSGFGPESVPVVVRDSYPEEAVRVAAYHCFLRRQETGAAGDEASDWIEAEKFVLRE